MRRSNRRQSRSRRTRLGCPPGFGPAAEEGNHGDRRMTRSFSPSQRLVQRLQQLPDKKMVEAFEIYVGGTLNAGGKFNEKLKGKVEAEKLYDVLKELILFFKEKKILSETFLDFVERVGKSELQSKLDNILTEVAV